MGKKDNLKREISLGFKKPKSLEENIIYVSLYKEEDFFGRDFKAIAISNEKFKYPVNNLIQKKFRLGKQAFSFGRGFSIPYKEFLVDLIKNNKGVLSYDRAIEEGVNVYSRIEKIKDLADFS